MRKRRKAELPEEVVEVVLRLVLDDLAVPECYSASPGVGDLLVRRPVAHQLTSIGSDHLPCVIDGLSLGRHLLDAELRIRERLAHSANLPFKSLAVRASARKRRMISVRWIDQLVNDCLIACVESFGYLLHDLLILLWGHAQPPSQNFHDAKHRGPYNRSS